MNLALLDEFLAHVPDAVFVIDAPGHIVLTNEEAARLSGYTQSELRSRMVEDLIPERMRGGHHRRRSSHFSSPQVRPMGGGSGQFALLHRDGHEVEVDIRLSPLLSDGQRLVLAAVRDITSIRQIERMCRRNETRFRALTLLSSDWYWETDDQLRFTYFSDMDAAKSAVPPTEKLGKTRFELPIEFESEAARRAHQETLQSRTPFRDLYVRSIETGKWSCVSGEPVFDDRGRFVGYQGVARNVTERKNAEEKLERLATKDTITGLTRRNSFNERLTFALDLAKLRKEMVGVIYLDLDRFKAINDTLGHDQGDRVLAEIAVRFQESVRKSDIVARLGGDEFAVVLEKPKDRERIAAIANKLVEEAQRPILLGQELVRTGASAGIASFPDDGADAPTLLRHADMAMYEAKGKGRGQVEFFTEALNRRVRERHALEQELREAVDRDEFDIHLQPQFDARTLELSGAEVLLRWRSPRRNLVSPDVFIPVAEECGLIHPIGDLVLNKSCRALGRWRANGWRLPKLAVNVSPRQLLHGGGDLSRMEACLRKAGLDAKYLEFEITESSFVSMAEGGNIALLEKLAQSGARIAIDDFGMGYSSLSYLQRLPLHAIKIDRSFVAGIPDDRGAMEITRAIMAMAHALNLTVTAEGVESETQLRQLQEWGCHHAQGFLMSKPLPEKEFEARYLAGPFSRWEA